MTAQTTIDFSGKRSTVDDGIQRRFERFHRENPHIYKKLVELARQVKSRGLKHYSIASLFERLRWHFRFETKSEEPFKLNNDFRSRYARLVMETESDLADFFDLRELRREA